MIAVVCFISVLYMTGDKKSTVLVKLDRFILLRGKPIKTLGSFYQAANANCESFAFTFFA